MNKKWQRFLFGSIVIFWIMACLYVWWILNGTPGLESISRSSPKITIIVQDSFARIWPYVWRQYIYTQ